MFVKHLREPEKFCHGGIVHCPNYKIACVLCMSAAKVVPLVFYTICGPLTLNYFLCVFLLKRACARPRWSLILISFSRHDSSTRANCGVFRLLVM